MTLVTLFTREGRLHCRLSDGRTSADGEAKTFLAAIAKTYFKLMSQKLRTKILKRRDQWTAL